MRVEREYVNFVIEEGIVTVTVDRPPVNAWNVQVQEEVREVFEQLSTRNDFRVVILTGGGGKAFIAGADLRMISGLCPKEALVLSSGTQGVVRLIEEFERVVIAAISGLAMGGGCEVALACDIRVAEEGASIGLPEVALGLIPGAGGTQRLPMLVGLGKAKQLIFTGDPISAREAQEIGLVEEVAPRGEALAVAKRIARRILERAPLAVVKAKKAIHAGLLSMREGYHAESALFSELFATEDQKEGARAFLEKRRPRFTGR